MSCRVHLTAPPKLKCVPPRGQSATPLVEVAPPPHPPLPIFMSTSISSPTFGSTFISAAGREGLGSRMKGMKNFFARVDLIRPLLCHLLSRHHLLPQLLLQ